MNDKYNICLVASAGGHISQLLKLADSWEGHESFYITTLDVVAKSLQGDANVYVVGE